MAEFDEERFKEEAQAEIEEQLDKELDDIADAIMADAQKNLDKQRLWRSSYSGKVYTAAITDIGFLAGSGRVIKEHLKKTIKFDAPYSAGVEFGTPPHMVDEESIETWTRRKLGVKQKNARHVAKLIARKIAVHGTDPKPYLRPAIDVHVNRGEIKYEVTIHGNNHKRR